MSDSEDTKPGASSALLNIASAYSDSDSSQENTEDCTPQKSLGSLVENLRAKANRFDGDVTKVTEEQSCSTPTTSGPSSDAEKSQSVTKIVRLDSGKVVKIKTSSGSKALEVRPEEAALKRGNNLTDPSINTQDISTLQSNDPRKETKSEDSVQREVKTDVNDLESRISNDKNRCEDVNSATNRVKPHAFDADLVNAVTAPAMGIRNTKEDVKPDDDIIIESETVLIPPQEALAKTSVPVNQSVKRLPGPPENSKRWISGISSVTTSECDDDDDIQDVTPIDIIQGTMGLKTTQKEEQKTESNILNAYLKSKQGLKTEDNVHRNTAVEKNYEMNRSPEIMFLGRSFERGNIEKSGTAGSVAGSNINTPVRGDGIVKTDESLRGFSAEEGLVSKLDIYEVKPRPELKPLPRLDRIKMRSTAPGSEGQLKKTEQDRQTSSTLYKMLESPSIQDVKKGQSPAPIKLKRNFSCISSASITQPEKKFIPEPSESARITSTDSEISSDILAGPSIPEITVIPPEPRPQKEETMKSPPRVQIPSPSRSAISPTYQQISPHSYQPSFTNMINASPNQVPSFQPLKKSPQPVSPQPFQRNSRREEPKRTLPLILRKADISGAKAREPHRIDETGPKAPFRKDDVSASKMIAEGDISMETISLESQEQSASVPFSNSSSNQENSNFSSSVNFGNVIGSSGGSKKPETLSEDGGSDNARPPPTPTKDERDEKQQTSFLSQQVEPVEMPTIIIPKKRGRPRKFPLPEPSTLVGTWPTADKNGKASGKSGKRKKNYKKFKGEQDITDDDDTSKKRYIPRYKKKTKPTGEESEVTRSFNKKGRMEVVTEGCKPVTVNQITEYFWPPLSSLPPGEKPEGLMIQEQISEYLGVKSFKRKYPSIKRRTVDMEERNYLQENGYVSENMCDMGLTAVYSADIMEIMYNDFPHKFEEYRRFTREKKMREQKALREKQAAENMDPRKEALESIVSWNTEFNSSRKMDKPKRNYNYQVLLGEWYERRVDEELKIAMYLKKKERGQLLLTKIRRLFSNMLKDVQLTLSTTGLAHGGLVQLIAPDVPGYSPTDLRASNNGLVLAVTMEADDVDYNQDFDDNLPIVGSPALAPCARNAFYIVPEDAKKKGQPLCFGDVFFLKCSGDTEIPFYVTVPVLSPFGAVGKCSYPIPRLSVQKNFDSRFKVHHIAEHLRKETLGFPVSPFEKVLIVHAPVNIPLCVERWFWKNSLFSAECEISIRSTQNVRKEYDEANKWIFVVGSVK